jgi:hypothetical protein
VLFVLSLDLLHSLPDGDRESYEEHGDSRVVVAHDQKDYRCRERNLFEDFYWDFHALYSNSLYFNLALHVVTGVSRDDYTVASKSAPKIATALRELPRRQRVLAEATDPVWRHYGVA